MPYLTLIFRPATRRGLNLLCPVDVQVRTAPAAKRAQTLQSVNRYHRA